MLSDHVLAQLLRFATVGGIANLGYLLPFLALHGNGTQVANAVGSVVSTALASELHRRLTFRSARVGRLTAQLKGGGTALAAFVASAATLAVLDHTAPELSGPAAAAAVLTVSAIVGGLRFLSLRHWVFRDVAGEFVQPGGGGGVAGRAPVTAW
ncbi:GtrA family protein [Nocardia sp. NPDC048505]|uniref:GtrA family protein n=1 Tax=Nocardia sp. NPDC048505 TaxID=3155756 RepID=UPI0033EC1325